MLIRFRNRLPLLIAICWLGLASAFLVQLTILKVIFGLPVVLVFPGLLIVRLLNLDAESLERWTLIGVASVAVLIGSVMAASLTAAGVVADSILRVLAAITIVLYVCDLIAWRLRSRFTTENQAMAIETSGNRGTQSPVQWRSVVAWSMSASVIVASLGVAIWLSMSSDRVTSQPDFTQLSMMREGTSNVYRIEITNLEGSEAKYQLELSLPATGTTLQTVTLEAQETFQKEIFADHPGEIVARLYGGSATENGYRQVKAVIS